MFKELIVAILISSILLYLFYLYLAWCSNYSSIKTIYNTTPMLVMAKDKAVIEKYGSFIMPEHLTDTYKPIRFWVLYYKARVGL